MCAIMRAFFTNHMSKGSNIRLLSFWGGGGGVFEWFGLGKFGLGKFFFRDIWWCKIFFQHYTSGGIIFLCEGCLFPRYFLPTYYFPSKSVSRIFFSSNHPSINPCLHPLPPPQTQKSNGRKPICSPALPKQRLLLVLESSLQILHYKTVLVNYLLSYFLSYPIILTVGFAANYNKAFL